MHISHKHCFFCAAFGVVLVLSEFKIFRIFWLSGNLQFAPSGGFSHPDGINWAWIHPAPAWMELEATLPSRITQHMDIFESGSPIILIYSFTAISMKDKKQEGGDQGCQILKELIPSSHHTAKSATPEPKTGLSSFILPALMIFSTKILSEDNIFIQI